MACYVFAYGHARALLKLGVVNTYSNWFSITPSDGEELGSTPFAGLVRSLVLKKGERIMVLKRLIGLVFAGALAFSAAAADIVIRIAPPRVKIEKRAPPPSRNHVWVSG